MKYIITKHKAGAFSREIMNDFETLEDAQKVLIKWAQDALNKDNGDFFGNVNAFPFKIEKFEEGTDDEYEVEVFEVPADLTSFREDCYTYSIEKITEEDFNKAISTGRTIS